MRDFSVETWERHRVRGIKYHSLPTSILQLHLVPSARSSACVTESASFPIPQYWYLVLDFVHICPFTFNKVVFFRAKQPHIMLCDVLPLLKTGVSEIDHPKSWPPPFLTSTSFIAIKKVGHKSGLETSNANDTHSLSVLYTVVSVDNTTNATVVLYQQEKTSWNILIWLLCQRCIWYGTSAILL